MHCHSAPGRSSNLAPHQPVPRPCYLSLWGGGDKPLNSVTWILSVYPSLTHIFMGYMSHRPIQRILQRPRVLQASSLPCVLPIGHTGADSPECPGASNILYVHPHNCHFVHPLCPVTMFCLSLKPRGDGKPMGMLPLGFSMIPSWPLLVFFSCLFCSLLYG